MKTVAIIQARTGSQRLPGKVLEEISGKTMLEHVVVRTKLCPDIDRVVVATTIESSDDRIESLCGEKNWNCFRGSETDVLDRYYQAASHHAAQVVVRITSDCPLVDPFWISKVVQRIQAADWTLDYASNVFPKRTLPRGLDVEALTISTLRKLWLQCKQQRFREHVTLGITSQPDNFRVHNVVNESDLSEFRWTVDTQSDLQLVRKIFEQFSDNRFTWQQVLQLYDKFPRWKEINRDVTQKVA